MTLFSCLKTHRFYPASIENRRRIVRAAGIVCACWLTGAGAHGQSDSLGAAASSTDFWELECFNDQGNPSGDPHELFFEVRGGSKSPVQVSAQVLNGNQAYSTTDPLSGDSAFSPSLVIVHDGSDVYQILVDKNGPGAVNYSLEYHCQSSNGAHTGTSELKYLQLQ